MSADDLRTLIRTDVLADEPPFAMSGSRWREAGARVVRRRRRVHVATSLVAVGFLAGALMIVPRLHVGVRHGDARRRRSGLSTSSTATPSRRSSTPRSATR